MLNKKIISIGGSTGVALTAIMLVMALGTTEITNEISTDGMPKKFYGAFPPSMAFNDFAGDKTPEFVEEHVAGQSETRSNEKFARYNSLKSAVAGYNTLELFTNDKKGEEDIILGKKSVSSDSRTNDILYSQDYIWITKNTHREDVALDVYTTIPLNDGYKLVDINKDVRNAPLREMIHMVGSEDNTIGISPLDVWFVTDDYSYTIRGHLTETQAIDLANKILKLEN
ncbi:MAG: hypothetical protein J4F36_04915 [Nitrosopumilaceae archaeon]|nr:hypothetical protein [Nitrosopumilaceae archaeon]